MSTLTYDKAALVNYIEELNGIYDELQGLQKTLTSRLYEFSDTWKTSASGATLARLDYFLNGNAGSIGGQSGFGISLADILTNLETNIANLNTAVGNIEIIDSETGR